MYTPSTPKIKYALKLFVKHCFICFRRSFLNQFFATSNVALWKYKSSHFLNHGKLSFSVLCFWVSLNENIEIKNWFHRSVYGYKEGDWNYSDGSYTTQKSATKNLDIGRLLLLQRLPNHPSLLRKCVMVHFETKSSYYGLWGIYETAGADHTFFIRRGGDVQTKLGNIPNKHKRAGKREW